ncbi:MAG: alpha/beta fold hydrolase [Pigmentiphaga sp.]|nr:alpha/beta fold hydrolase [Pigmentiphaga sp.]
MPPGYHLTPTPIPIAYETHGAGEELRPCGRSFSATIRGSLRLRGTTASLDPALKDGACAWARGQPLVFIHGVGGNRRNWDDQLDHFAPAHQVVTLDLRGYGDSGPITGDLRFEHFAEDVLAVMDHLGAERAHLAGLSMGGLVAQAVYAHAPHRIASLTLAACRPADAPVAAGEQFARDRLEPLRAAQPLQALADSLLPALHGPSASPELIGRLRDSLLRLRIDDYRRIVTVRTQLQPFLDLSSITVPALVLGGRDDRLAPPAQMTALAAAIPHSRLEIFEDCGHFLNIEQAASFNSTLASFLATHATA